MDRRKELKEQYRQIKPYMGVLLFILNPEKSITSKNKGIMSENAVKKYSL